jgi:hypothetical protein
VSVASQSVPAQRLVNAAVPFSMPTTPASCVLRFASGSTILATKTATVQ